VLEEIGRRQHSNLGRLQAVGDATAEILKAISAVHSLKIRAKSPEHLVEKVIRKRCEKPEIDIKPDNYQDHITDLVGVRALHLFKDEWLPIHEFVTATWHLAEQPLAYIREGDATDLQEQFAKKGCAVTPHPKGYRSVHYLLSSQPTKDRTIVELQVRTIFEEGWSEIDHRVRYPYKRDDAILSQYLVMFNRFAGSADEMGTFLRFLTQIIEAERAKTAEAQRAFEKVEVDLKATISKLKVSEQEKMELGKQLDELKEKQVAPLSALTALSLKGLPDFSTAFGNLDWSKLKMPEIKLSANLMGIPCKKCGEPISPLLTLAASAKCPKCGSTQ
jgi:ppGpp synthetase/RelA/SpoT-type nucleotidyltranferase